MPTSSAPAAPSTLMSVGAAPWALSGPVGVLASSAVVLAVLSAPLAAGFAIDRAGGWPTSPADPQQCGLYEGPPHGPVEDDDGSYDAACGEDIDDALSMMQKRTGFKVNSAEKDAKAWTPRAPGIFEQPHAGGGAATTQSKLEAMAAAPAAASVERAPGPPPPAALALWGRCPSPPPATAAPGGTHAAGGAWSRVDVLGAADWDWPQQRPPRFVDYVAGLFCTLPAVVVYGLLWLVGGSGCIQLLATAAFWVLVRPAAAALESLFFLYLQCPGAPVRLAASYATAAHFYWAWGAVEVATRRRPLWDRLAFVAVLSAVLLPIPAAQVLLDDRVPMQAAAGALLGQVLGVGFFFGLRFTGLWTHLQVGMLKDRSDKTLGVMSRWVKPWDNLTTSWGGSIWPPEHPMVPLKAMPISGIVTSDPVRPL